MSVRDTPVTFTLAEMDAVEATVHDDGTATCPRCHRLLVAGPAAVGDGGTVREWLCPECARCAMLRDG